MDGTPNEYNVTFFFPDEDDTLGNLVRHKLLLDPRVIFAAYKVPHPLKRSVEVRVQTVETPVKETMAASIDGLVQDLDAFNRAFNEALDC
jgi:DNA-directed RNA polymerase subunit L